MKAFWETGRVRGLVKLWLFGIKLTPATGVLPLLILQTREIIIRIPNNYNKGIWGISDLAALRSCPPLFNPKARALISGMAGNSTGSRALITGGSGNSTGSGRFITQDGLRQAEIVTKSDDFSPRGCLVLAGLTPMTPRASGRSPERKHQPSHLQKQIQK